MSRGAEVELTGVTRRFGTRTAVEDVSLTVHPGEVLGLLGPNGAGKTTTMRMLVGFLRPDSGQIRVGAVDAAVDPVGVRRQIGYLPEVSSAYPEMTVLDFLGYCARLRRLPRPTRDVAIGRAMADAGLAGQGRVRIGTLSRGYRQRVGLAQALVHDPDVLVLDEPTAGLDPRQRVEVRDLVARLGRTRTVLLSSHLLSEVTDLCRRVAVLDNGRLVALEEVAVLAARAGSRLELRVSGSAPRAAQAVAGVAGVESVEVRGQVVVVTGDARLAGADLAAAVVSAGVGLEEMRAEGGSLEAAYLRLVKP